MGGHVITQATRTPSPHAQADNLEAPPGKYAHLGGGLSVVYDLSQPAGSRLVSLQYNCVEVADGDSFRLATNNFVAAGGDEYTFFVGLERVLLFGPGLADAFAAYLGDATPPGGAVRSACVALRLAGPRRTRTGWREAGRKRARCVQVPLELIDLEGRIVDVADVADAACPLEGSGGVPEMGAGPGVGAGPGMGAEPGMYGAE